MYCHMEPSDIIRLVRWATTTGATASVPGNYKAAVGQITATHFCKNMTQGKVRFSIWKCYPRNAIPVAQAVGTTYTAQEAVIGNNPAYFINGFANDQGTASQADGKVVYTDIAATPYMSRRWCKNFKLSKPKHYVLGPGETIRWQVKAKNYEIDSAAHVQVDSDGTHNVTFPWLVDKKYTQCIYLMRIMGDISEDTTNHIPGWCNARLGCIKMVKYNSALISDQTDATGAFTDPTWGTSLQQITQPSFTAGATTDS